MDGVRMQDFWGKLWSGKREETIVVYAANAGVIQVENENQMPRICIGN